MSSQFTFSQILGMTAEQIKALPSEAEHKGVQITEPFPNDQAVDPRHVGRWNSLSADSFCFDTLSEQATSYDSEHAALVAAFCDYNGIEIPDSWRLDHELCTE
jgi:hypothetical protein